MSLIRPEIRLRHSRLMTANVSMPLLKLARGKDAVMPSNDYFEERAQEYRNTWEQYEERIVSGMMAALNLTFYLPVIDVTLAPMISPFSTPLIMSYKPEPDLFVDILAHELVHVLLSDNLEGVKFRQFLDVTWADEARLTKNHIGVHAMLEHLFVSVLEEPERMVRDKDLVSGNLPYKRAWDIVETEGSKAILDKFRDHRAARQGSSL